MSSVDNRVVQMVFDNAKFQEKIGITLESMKELTSQLSKLQGAKSAQNLASKIDASGFSASMADISSKVGDLGSVSDKVFGALPAKIGKVAKIATGVLGGAVTAVTGMIVHGGAKRSKNIQHAMYMFENMGLKEEKLTAITNEVNDSVTDTAYGYDQAAVAAAQFYASGITSAEQQRMALNAVADVASLTDSEYSDISRIFTTVAGQGRLMGEQMNQLGARGMNVAADLGKAFGKTEADIRQMVKKGEISFEDFAGAMEKVYGGTAKGANRTVSGLMSNMKAALSRMGQIFTDPFFRNADADNKGGGFLVQTFGNVLPILKNVRDSMMATEKNARTVERVFNRAGTTISNAINKPLEALAYNADGSRRSYEKLGRILYNVTRGVLNIIKSIGSLLKPIGQAFSSVFGDDLVIGLLRVTRAFAAIAKHIKNFLAQEEVQKDMVQAWKALAIVLKLVMTIVGGIAKIAGAVLGPVLGLIFKLLVKVGAAIGTLLEKITGNGDAFGALADIFDIIADALGKFMQLITGGLGTGLSAVIDMLGGGLTAALQGLGDALAFVVDKAGKFKDFISGLMPKGSNDPAKGVDGVTKSVKDSVKGFGIWSRVADKAGGTFKTLGDGAKTGLGKLADALSNVKKESKGSILDSKDAVPMNVPQTFQQNMQKYGQQSVNSTLEMPDWMKGIADTFKKWFHELGEAISNASIFEVGHFMHNALRELFVGKWINDLVKGSTRMTKGITSFLDTFGEFFKDRKFGQFGLDVKLILGPLDEFKNTLTSMQDTLGAYKKGAYANILLKLAGAIILLGIGVRMLAGLKWEELTVGLTGVTVLLGEMTAIMMLFSKKFDPTAFMKIGSAGTFILKLSVAVLILSDALSRLAEVPSDQLWNSVGAITALMAGLTGSMVVLSVVGKAMNDTSKGLKKGKPAFISAGIAILLLSASLRVLTDCVAILAQYSIQQIATGLIALMGGLFGMAGAMILLEKFGGTGPKLLVTSVAIAIVAGSMLLLATSLAMLAQCQPENLIVALLALSVSVIAIAAAGVIAQSGVLGLLALSAAFLALSLALTPISAIIASVVTAITFLATLTGAESEQLIQNMMTIAEGMGKAAGLLAVGVIEGLRMVADALAENTGPIIDSLITALQDLIDRVDELIPLVVQLGVDTIVAFAEGLAEGVPRIIAAVFYALGQIAIALGVGIPMLADDVAIAVEEFFERMAGTIMAHKEPMKQALHDFIAALVSDIPIINKIIGPPSQKALEAYGKQTEEKAAQQAEQAQKKLDEEAAAAAAKSSAPESVKEVGAQVPEAYADGVTESAENMDSSGLMDKMMSGVLDPEQMKAMAESAGIDLPPAIMDGMTSGFSNADWASTFDANSLGNSIGNAMEKPAEKAGKKVPEGVKKGMSSSDGKSKVKKAAKGLADSTNDESVKTTYNNHGQSNGKSYDQGVATGINNNTGPVGIAVNDLGQKMKDQLAKKIKSHSPSKVGAELGRFWDMGVALGIDSLRDDVGRSAAAVGDVMIARMSRSMQASADILGQIDANPVIRPVLDLSMYEAGIAQMQRLSLGTVGAAAYGFAGYSPFGNITINEKTVNNNMEVGLDYSAGAGPNAIVDRIAEAISASNLLEG